MKAIFILAISLLFIGCNNPQTAVNQKEESQSDYLNIEESTCLFSRSEMQKYYKNSLKRSTLARSEYIKTLAKIIESLDKECNISLASDYFLVYLKSNKFAEESKIMWLEPTFQTDKIKQIQNAKNKYLALGEVAKAMLEITYSRESNPMIKSSAIQRISHVNKDTIELKKNISYSFPTEYLVNANLLEDANTQYEDLIIKGGNQLNTIRKEKIDVKYNNGVMSLVTKLDMYIKTIK